MRFNVASLLKSIYGSARTYEVNDEIDLFRDGRVCLMQGTVTLMHTNRGILARGELNTVIEVECARCLKETTNPLSLKIEEEYFPSIDIITGAPVPVPEDDPMVFRVSAQHEIDITEAVRQYAVMAVPMKPLCKPDCAGICPSCGKNLNEGACECPHEQADPRWAKLLEAVKKQKGNKSHGSIT